MRKFFKKAANVICYIFSRKGFFTKKLVVSSMTLLMMLYLNIQCEVWDGIGLLFFVLLSLYVICNYIIRYMDMKKEDEKLMEENKEGEKFVGPKSETNQHDDADQKMLNHETLSRETLLNSDEKGNILI